MSISFQVCDVWTWNEAGGWRGQMPFQMPKWWFLWPNGLRGHHHIKYHASKLQDINRRTVLMCLVTFKMKVSYLTSVAHYTTPSNGMHSYTNNAAQSVALVFMNILAKIGSAVSINRSKSISRLSAVIENNRNRDFLHKNPIFFFFFDFC